MSARRIARTNNHLEEAMALLIRNQAGFVDQIARNDQERLALQRKAEEWQFADREWKRNAELRFDKLEQRLARIESDIVNLPKNIIKTILDQLPKIRKEIGFKSPS